VYYNGLLYRDYHANLGDTALAVRTALLELQLPLIKEKGDPGSAYLESRTGDGSTVRIFLDVVPSPIPAEGAVTRVGVRVGFSGDDAVSARVLDQISRHLVSPTAAPPPAAPAPVVAAPPPGPETAPPPPAPALPPPGAGPAGPAPQAGAGRRRAGSLTGPPRAAKIPPGLAPEPSSWQGRCSAWTSAAPPSRPPIPPAPPAACPSPCGSPPAG